MLRPNPWDFHGMPTGYYELTHTKILASGQVPIRRQCGIGCAWPRGCRSLGRSPTRPSPPTRRIIGARHQTAPAPGESATRRGHLPQAPPGPYTRHGPGRCGHLRRLSPVPSRWRSHPLHRSPMDTWQPMVPAAGDWAQISGRRRGGHRPSDRPVPRYCDRRGQRRSFDFIQKLTANSRRINGLRRWCSHPMQTRTTCGAA